MRKSLRSQLLFWQRDSSCLGNGRTVGDPIGSRRCSKKGAPSDPNNYRGVHLTTVLSKTIERVIGRVLGTYFEETAATGESQWAFRPGHSCRDLVAFLAATWILDLHGGKKIGFLLADISGAFDRVKADLLIEKLRATGVQEDMLKFLTSYLERRHSTIIVEGASSRNFELEDTIFQGTVLGPKLWNVFFEDVSQQIPPPYKDAKFADDLTCFKSFPGDSDNKEIKVDLHECEAAVQDWGKRNQVLFDEKKAEFGVIHLTDGEGDTVRILGSMFDNALHMDENIKKMVGKARPKITALLRCRRFYDRANMIKQYKTHVLCLLEGNPGAYYHACDTVLGPLERIQTSFLKQMDMDTGFAFLGYNLAPLSTRRDIAVLGFIY